MACSPCCRAAAVAAAIDELIGAARLLAERLGGVLHDDRGAQLSLQRISQLREEVAEFERSRAAHPPGH